MNGDPNQTSTKLRLKAIDVIRQAKRPLATHEIANWVRTNDPELYSLIQSKCSDYVRIIISVTHDGLIVKYKSLVPVEGVDKRSTFYGLSDEKYSPEWVRCNGKSNRHIRRSSYNKKPAAAQQKQATQRKTQIQIPKKEFTQKNDDYVPLTSIFEGIDFEAEWNQSPYMDPVNFGL